MKEVVSLQRDNQIRISIAVKVSRGHRERPGQRREVASDAGHEDAGAAVEERAISGMSRGFQDHEEAGRWPDY